MTRQAGAPAAFARPRIIFDDRRAAAQGDIAVAGGGVEMRG
jgi:hypothetical protein